MPKLVPRAWANRVNKPNINAKTKNQNGSSTAVALAKKEVKPTVAKSEAKPKPVIKLIKPTPPTPEEIEAMVQLTRTKSEKRNLIIAHLDRFTKTKEDLNETVKSQGTDFDPDMDSEELHVTFASNGSPDVEISNNLLARYFIDLLSQKIDDKIDSLNADLLSV